MKEYNCVICKKKMVKNGIKIIKHDCYYCVISVYEPWSGAYKWIMDMTQWVNGKRKSITINGDSFEECERLWKLRVMW